MFLHMAEVEYLGGYNLKLKFNNGVTKIVDLQPELYGNAFEALKNVNFFQQLFVNPETNTIEWPNGADFAPEFLYEIGQELKVLKPDMLQAA